jgi:hypothetical protein
MVRQGSSGNHGSKPKVSRSGQPARGPARAAGRKSGQKPANPVFRRRRLLVGAGLVLVFALAFGGFAVVSSFLDGGQPPAAGSGDSTAVQQTAPAAGPEAPSASATPSPTAAANGCDQNLVTVTAATDKPAYAAGESPLLILKVTNGNKVPCEINIGTSQMEFLVTSGTDRIFSSTDCQADSTDLVKTVAPGQSETANFPWQRNRTVQGCAPIEAKPAVGTYVFTARLASKTSPRAVFKLN